MWKLFPFEFQNLILNTQFTPSFLKSSQKLQQYDFLTQVTTSIQFKANKYDTQIK